MFVILTNNERRRPEQVDKANPRPQNEFGHIIEMTAPDGDHAAATFRWDMLVKCGDPRIAEVGALWHPDTSASGWFASPDNCAIDAQGRLWIATDQGASWSRKTQQARRPLRARDRGRQARALQAVLQVPVGAELCGPCFTPDGETVFVAVQHPATDGVKDWKPFGRELTFEDPATRWPDFKPGHAAAAGHRCHPQEGRRQDRVRVRPPRLERGRTWSVHLAASSARQNALACAPWANL